MDLCKLFAGHNNNNKGRISLNNFLLILFFFTFGIIKSQDLGKLSDLKFWTYGESVKYYEFDDEKIDSVKKKIYRVKIKDSIFEYYISGNLKGKGAVKLDKIDIKTFYPSNRKDTCYTYSYEGDWIIYFNDSTQSIAQTGELRNQEKNGEWITYSFDGKKTKIINYKDKGYTIKIFDSLEKDISQKEYIYNALGHSVLVENSNENAVTNRSKLLRFLYSNSRAFIMIFLFIFFIRVPINHFIFELEENRDITLFWFPWMSSERFYESIYHSFRCTFKFWWFKHKTKHKWLVVLSHFFSIIFVLLIILLVLI